MTDERFEEIISEFLCHANPEDHASILTLVLRSVVDIAGKAGDRALEKELRLVDPLDRYDG